MWVLACDISPKPCCMQRLFGMTDRKGRHRHISQLGCSCRGQVCIRDDGSMRCQELPNQTQVRWSSRLYAPSWRLCSWTLDMPNIVHGLAAFKHTWRDMNETSVGTATRSVAVTGWPAVGWRTDWESSVLLHCKALHSCAAPEAALSHMCI